MTGRTRTVAVVFTDLVGSTALASELGPAGAERLRQAHFAALRAAVAATRGMEVKNLGDGLMIAYDGASAAMDGAVAMQQAIFSHNRTAEVELAIRVGVSIGEVVEEDDDFFGEPVVEAARLCAAAEGGQILVTEFVAGLGRRTGPRAGPDRHPGAEGPARAGGGGGGALDAPRGGDGRRTGSLAVSVGGEHRGVRGAGRRALAARRRLEGRL